MHCLVGVLLQLNTSRPLLALTSFLFLSVANSHSSMCIAISLIWDTTINWSVRPYHLIIVLADFLRKPAIIAKQKRRERNMLHLCRTAYCFGIISGLTPLGTVGHFRNCSSYKYGCLVHPTPYMLGGFLSKQLIAEQTALKSVHKHLLYQWFHKKPTHFHLSQLA